MFFLCVVAMPAIPEFERLRQVIQFKVILGYIVNSYHKTTQKITKKR
jgi:hypothetical protein